MSEVEMINETEEKKIEREIPKSFYTILGAKSFRANSPYNLAITLHDPEHLITEPCSVRIQIIQNIDNEQNNLHDQTVDITPNTTEAVTINVGDVDRYQKFKLLVTSEKGLKFKHEARLSIQSKSYAILIQTDKAIYKPNDCIRFRVLVLDAQLRPSVLKTDKLNVYIADSSSNRLKQWSGVDTKRGVFSGEFELSDAPNLGDWHIFAEVGDESKSKYFDVKEYVPPKFEAFIETLDEYCAKEENLTVFVGGKYTYGKLMKGKATVGLYKRWSDTCNTEKVVPFEGRTQVDFKMLGDVVRTIDSRQEDCWEVKVKIEEELTGLSQSTSKSINIRESAFNVKFITADDSFTPGTPFTVKVKVTKYDDSPIQINENTKNITVKRENCVSSKETGRHKENVYTSCEDYELDENGELELEFSTTDKDVWFQLETVYLDEENSSSRYYKFSPPTKEDIPPLKVECLTKDIKIGQEVTVKVTAAENLKVYHYYVIGQEKLLYSQSVYLPDNSTNSHEFTFLATKELAPQAKVVACILKSEEIVSDKITISLEDKLYNNIDVNLSLEKAAPGEQIDITVKTNPNSYIGLLGIDQSILLLRGDNDLSLDDALSQRAAFYRNLYDAYDSYDDYHSYWYDFKRIDMIFFTNIIPKLRVEEGIYFRCGVAKRSCNMRKVKKMRDCVEEAQSDETPSIRKDFPETWIWDENPDENHDGLWTLQKKVPDTITSWVVTGFSIDPVNGLALLKEPKKLTVFQSFFISLNLPYSVKRGEVVTIPANIFNYLEHDIQAEVTLINEHDEFEFIDSAVNDIIQPELAQKKSRKKKVTIRSNNGATANFIIKPKKIGAISLKVTATSEKASDGILKLLNVESEGVPLFANKPVFVDLRDVSTIDPVTVKIDVPENALPDATRVEIRAIGDLLGGTIKNLKNLIRLPYGCGEQNMLNFVPNIVVLDYLINTHQLTPELKALAIKYLEVGYQKELTYKHYDGSFSCFGRSDNEGSTWLTAFVVKSFIQAAKYIKIEKRVIDDALDWLSGCVQDDGSFKEKGSIFQRDIQGGSANGLGLTAYVLTAFLENKNWKDQTEDLQYSSIIEKALKNIETLLNSVKDVYTLGIATYALQLANHPAKETALNNFINMAKVSDGHMWWEKTIPIQSYWSKQSLTLNTELTAYGLLSLIIAQDVNKALPVLKWLLGQRNSQGGFEGTQDTIVGLEALAKCAVYISAAETNIELQIKSDGTARSWTIDKNNSLILNTEVLSPSTKSVDVSAAGKGFALFEVSYKYFVKEPEPAAAFKLEPVPTLQNSGNFELNLSLCLVSNDKSETNMVILEVSFPSGFVADKDSLKKLLESLKIVKKVETKNDDTVAIIYFDSVTSEQILLKLFAFQTHIVTQCKPAPVIVYDYYDNALSARSFYSLPEVQA